MGERHVRIEISDFVMRTFVLFYLSLLNVLVLNILMLQMEHRFAQYAFHALHEHLHGFLILLGLVFFAVFDFMKSLAQRCDDTDDHSREDGNVDTYDSV